MLYCNQCARYLQPPRHWIRADLESKELLTFCIKRVKGLGKVKLTDAGFIWTEPHSKRLKIKLTVQKEVLNGAILQQTFVVEFVVEWHMCDACSRAAANADQWTACVQVRQKVEHKRTFLFLEQLILKHGMEANTIGIKSQPDGLDFYYGSRSHGLKLLDFLQQVVPVRARHDKQLVSHDANNNTYNYQYTFMVEIVPVCKEDIVCLPYKVSLGLGGVGPIMLVTRGRSFFPAHRPVDATADLGRRGPVLQVPVQAHRLREDDDGVHRAGRRTGGHGPPTRGQVPPTFRLPGWRTSASTTSSCTPRRTWATTSTPGTPRSATTSRPCRSWTRSWRSTSTAFSSRTCCW